jgi:PAS domain S-box-containing protein
MADTRKAPTPISSPRQDGAEGASAELFKLLIDSVQDYAIFALDPEGHVLTWNAGAEKIKGYAKHEILGKHFSIFYLPEALQSSWPQRELALAEKEGRFADEGWRLRKDGSSFWASVIITALRGPDGRLTGFAKVTQDMTERRRTEERVQDLNRELRARVTELDESRRIVELRTLELQKLSAQLMRVQDEERRRVARELHDDLGQQIAGLKMLLGASASKEVSAALDAAGGSVRSMSYLLHPPLLDEAGLKSALHWYVEGLAKRSQIDISLKIRPLELFPRFSKDIETTIFRIVQEALTNVYRHAQTKRAQVEIDKQTDWIVVRVRDYGKGIPKNVAEKMSQSTIGIGISGMRERLRQLGGELTLSPAEPGTLLEAKIPLFA